jgi:hypothetical protein
MEFREHGGGDIFALQGRGHVAMLQPGDVDILFGFGGKQLDRAEAMISWEKI